MYQFVRKILFLFDPERVHHVIIALLKGCVRGPLRTWLEQSVPRYPVTVMGLQFPNPVGLAAGFDQHGECLGALSALGFGFVEVGGVSVQPQAGNPRPRLFRLPYTRALINRKGFPNRGVDAVVAEVKKSKHGCVVGINVTKNRDTPLTEATADYLYHLRAAYGVVDYVAINVSSPNTPGLRQLQGLDALTQLLIALKKEQQKLTQQYQRYVPLVVKIAPDLTTQEIEQIADTLLATQMDGVIATNTTLSRAGVAGCPHAEEAGGLSGQPLRDLSTAVVRTLYQRLGDRIPIIACGGIMSAEDAREKLAAGARLVQIYTGFIYQGPKLIRECVAAFKS
jgi:dihydroorotate dehydrogenase